MHVLGLPPAFVLSQDQTLKLKQAMPVLDVRTSAHLALPARQGTSVCRASVSSGNRSRQTVKLTRTSSGKPLVRRYAREPIHRMEPGRPHISSDTRLSKNAGKYPLRGKNAASRTLLAAPPARSCHCCRSRNLHRNPENFRPLCRSARPGPRQGVAAPSVERYLRALD